MTAVTAVAVLPGTPDGNLGDAFVVAIFGLAALFSWSYGWLSNWRATAVGRAVFYMGTALALFAAQVAVSAWISTSYWGRDELRLVLYAALACTVFNIWWTWLQEHQLPVDAPPAPIPPSYSLMLARRLGRSRKRDRTHPHSPTHPG